MITVGIIKEKLYDKDTLIYKVDLSIFKSPGIRETDLTTTIIEATASVAPGTYEPYNIEDKVYVGFINNELGQPVILGKIAQRLDEETEASSLSRINSLVVTNNVILPEDIKIGDLNYTELKNAVILSKRLLSTSDTEISFLPSIKGYLDKGKSYAAVYWDTVNFIWSTSLSSFSTSNLWTDGNNIYYYASSSNYYIFDRNTKTWNTIYSTNSSHPQPPTACALYYKFYYKGNIYCSYRNIDKVLKKDSNEWEILDWKYLYSLDGQYVWNDINGDTYYLYNSASPSENVGQMKFNKQSKQWEYFNQMGSATSAFNGKYIWNDGTNIYHSSFSYQNILDKSTTPWTWKAKSWSNGNSWDSTYVWKSGDNIFLSRGTNQYKYNHSTLNWENASSYWTGVMTDFSGGSIWNDLQGNTYYSSGTKQYILHSSNDNQTFEWYPISTNVNVSGQYIWNDGTNIYYSAYGTPSTHYILHQEDSSTLIWEVIDFGINFSSEDVWNDGENSYLSTGGSTNYIFDKQQKKWNIITFENILPIDGSKIWTDGNNLYCSSGINCQKKLNESTNMWEDMKWVGQYYPSYGSEVWTDGENIYYSNIYYLDRNSNMWKLKDWGDNFPFTPPSNFNTYLWTDGDYLYYSNSYFQYIFMNGMWKEMVWLKQQTTSSSSSGLNKLTNFYGYNVWSDNEHIYCYQGSNHYILKKSSIKNLQPTLGSSYKY